MTDYETIPAGTIVGNCPACGFVLDDNVDDGDCETGFDCGRCGSFTPNRPIEVEDELSVPRESLADPEALPQQRGETPA